jgi:hypothetical protein
LRKVQAYARIFARGKENRWHRASADATCARFFIPFLLVQPPVGKSLRENRTRQMIVRRRQKWGSLKMLPIRRLTKMTRIDSLI